MPTVNPNEPFVRAKAVQNPKGAAFPVQFGSTIEFLNAEHATDFVNALGVVLGTVLSVAGRTGAVVLTSADLADAGTLATFDYVETQVAGKQDALSNASTLAKISESGATPTWDGAPWPGGADAQVVTVTASGTTAQSLSVALTRDDTVILLRRKDAHTGIITLRISGATAGSRVKVVAQPMPTSAQGQTLVIQTDMVGSASWITLHSVTLDNAPRANVFELVGSTRTATGSPRLLADRYQVNGETQPHTTYLPLDTFNSFVAGYEVHGHTGLLRVAVSHDFCAKPGSEAALMATISPFEAPPSFTNGGAVEVALDGQPLAIHFVFTNEPIPADTESVHYVRVPPVGWGGWRRVRIVSPGDGYPPSNGSALAISGYLPGMGEATRSYAFTWPGQEPSGDVSIPVAVSFALLQIDFTDADAPPSVGATITIEATGVPDAGTVSATFEAVSGDGEPGEGGNVALDVTSVTDPTAMGVAFKTALDGWLSSVGYTDRFETAELAGGVVRIQVRQVGTASYGCAVAGASSAWVTAPLFSPSSAEWDLEALVLSLASAIAGDTSSPVTAEAQYDPSLDANSVRLTHKTPERSWSVFGSEMGIVAYGETSTPLEGGLRFDYGDEAQWRDALFSSMAAELPIQWSIPATYDEGVFSATALSGAFSINDTTGLGWIFNPIGGEPPIDHADITIG